MKKLMLSLVIGFLSVSANATKMTCAFTEPFFNITFDSKTKVTTYSGADLWDEATGTFGEKVLSSNSRILSTDGNPGVQDSEYVLVDDTAGEVLLRLKLSFQGNDGMSDYIFPFDAWYGQYWGACETESAPAINTYELIDELL